MNQQNKTFWCLGLAIFVLLLLVHLTTRRFRPNFNEVLLTRPTNTVYDLEQDTDTTEDTTQVTNSNQGDSYNFKSSHPPLALLTKLAKKPTEMPNIIFAMADDLGWGDVEYNNGNMHTPSLNEMAKAPNTILLQRHYSGGTVCSPTRGTVLTGRNHNRYCLWSANRGRAMGDFCSPQRLPLPLSEITIADVMRTAGYSTALFGKWHLGDFKKLDGGNRKWPVSHPGLHGFDQWLATERSAPTCTINCACFKESECVLGHYDDTPPCTNYYTKKSDNLEAWKDPISGDDSHFIWSIAENYIREQVRENRPFFLYLPFHTVHKQYIATQQYRDMYLKKNYSLEQADYYGAISALDEVIGKLRKKLEELGIKNNTLVWFTSDNGPASYTPGVTNGLRGHKGSIHEGGIRVPGMIEWPNVITSNKISSFPVVTNDLLPTVYDILGIKPTDNRPIDGISILPFLQGKVEKRNNLIYWAYNIKGNFEGDYRAVVSDDQYKLVASYSNGTVVQYELYDLINDPGEKRDLSKSKQTISNELLHQLEKWRQSVIKSTKTVGCL